MTLEEFKQKLDFQIEHLIEQEEIYIHYLENYLKHSAKMSKGRLQAFNYVKQIIEKIS